MSIIKRTFTVFFILLGLISMSCSITPSSEPQPTFVPATPIPDWEKFEAEGVELWMPSIYVGGDVDNDLDVIIERGKSLGPKYKEMVDMLEKNSSAFILLIFDPYVGPSGGMTNVNVVKEKVLSTITIDKYLEALSSQFVSYSFQVLEQSIVQLDNYPAGKLVIQSNDLHVKEVMYVIKVKSTMWVTTYATGISEYSARRPVFEKSANTIKIFP